MNTKLDVVAILLQIEMWTALPNIWRISDARK